MKKEPERESTDAHFVIRKSTRTTTTLETARIKRRGGGKGRR
jgi:hypothetical protein